MSALLVIVACTEKYSGVNGSGIYPKPAQSASVGDTIIDTMSRSNGSTGEWTIFGNNTTSGQETIMSDGTGGRSWSYGRAEFWKPTASGRATNCPTSLRSVSAASP